jgi:hypothetical protein
VTEWKISEHHCSCGELYARFAKIEGVPGRKGRKREWFWVDRPCPYGNCTWHMCSACGKKITSGSAGSALWPDCPCDPYSHLRYQDRALPLLLRSRRVSGFLASESIGLIFTLHNPDSRIPKRLRDWMNHWLHKIHSPANEAHARHLDPDFFKPTET